MFSSVNVRFGICLEYIVYSSSSSSSSSSSIISLEMRTQYLACRLYFIQVIAVDSVFDVYYRYYAYGYVPIIYLKNKTPTFLPFCDAYIRALATSYWNVN